MRAITPAAWLRSPNHIRGRRNALLTESDWTQLPDVLSNNRLTVEKVAAWAVYRQALSDLPAALDVAVEPVDWPEPPIA